jgi:hypothetical protein
MADTVRRSASNQTLRCRTKGKPKPMVELTLKVVVAIPKKKDIGCRT